MPVQINFLGLSVTALVYRNNIGRWEIDDLRIDNDGHDMWHCLNDATITEIEERVITAAANQDYKWL